MVERRGVVPSDPRVVQGSTTHKSSCDSVTNRNQIFSHYITIGKITLKYLNTLLTTTLELQ